MKFGTLKYNIFNKNLNISKLLLGIDLGARMWFVAYFKQLI